LCLIPGSRGSIFVMIGSGSSVSPLTHVLHLVFFCLFVARSLADYSTLVLCLSTLYFFRRHLVLSRPCLTCSPSLSHLFIHPPPPLTPSFLSPSVSHPSSALLYPLLSFRFVYSFQQLNQLESHFSFTKARQLA
jgi:hypothetical protein